MRMACSLRLVWRSSTGVLVYGLHAGQSYMPRHTATPSTLTFFDNASGWTRATRRSNSERELSPSLIAQMMRLPYVRLSRAPAKASQVRVVALNDGKL
jgi:hypothetical protein